MFLEWDQLQQLLVALFGIVLLISGTRLYQFLIIVPGVSLGAYLGTMLSLNQLEEVQLFSIVLFSVFGIVVSLLLEKLAIALLGALLGGAIVQYIVPFLWGEELEWYWSTVGAVFGGMLVYPIFPSLIPFLSSLIGAYCLGWSMEKPDDYQLIGLLTIFGFFVQRLFGAKKPEREE